VESKTEADSNDMMECPCDDRTSGGMFGSLILHCVSKNVPTLTSCSFDKHGLILIIFGQQHQNTFSNDVDVQLSSFRHFYLLYLLLNSCDGNEAKQRVFLGR